MPYVYSRPWPLVIQTYEVLQQGSIVDTNDSMYGFNKVETATSYNLYIPNKQVANNKVNPPIDKNDNIGAVVSTTGAVDTVIVDVSAPVLYKNSGSDGTNVYLEFYYRKSNGSHDYDNPGWTQFTPIPIPKDWNNIKSSKPSKSETILTVTMNLPDTDYYDIKVVRSTDSVENPADVTTVNSVYLKQLREVSFEDLAYPCTALLGVRAKATDQLSGGMPNITSIVRGIKVQVPTHYVSYYDGKRSIRYFSQEWDGTMSDTKVWTDNPVWCLYDLLTNERYGLGKEFKILPSRRNIMLANFVQMAEYCDTYIRDDGTVTTYDDTSGRPRFSLNIVIDQQKSAREWVNTICGVMRATLFNCEGIVYLDIDREKEITQLFNMSNITNYSQSSVSFKSVPNAVQVQHTNIEKNYEVDSFIMETYDYQQSPDGNPVVINIDLLGVTSSKDAKNLAAYALDKAITSLTTVSFKTGTDLLAATVLDVIGVQHDVPMWGSGGRVVSYVENKLPTASTLSQFTVTTAGTVSQLTNLGCGIANGVACVKFSRTGTSGSDYRFYGPTLTFDKTQPYVFSLDTKVVQGTAEIWIMGGVVNNQANTQYRLCSLYTAGTVGNLGAGVTVLSVSTPDASGFRRVSLQINPSVFTGSGSTGYFGLFHGWSTIDTREAYYTRPQLEVGTVANTFVDGGLITLSAEYDYEAAANSSGALYGDLSISVSQDGAPPTTVAVTTPTIGTHSSIVITPQTDFTPKNGDVYILNFTTNTVKPFKIVNLKRDTDEFVEVTAIEYNGAIYGDSITSLGRVPVGSSYSTLTVPIKSSVTGFRVEKSVALNLLKSYRAVFDIWYDIPTPNTLWSGVVVAYCTLGDTRYKYLPLNSTGHIQFEAPIMDTADYQFIAISVWKDGTQQSIGECLADQTNVPYTTVHVDSTLPNDNFTGSTISGLETVGYQDGSFVGRDCKVQWKPVVVLSQSTEATDDAAGSDQSSSLLDHYTVYVQNIDGTVRRTARVYDEYFVYTHEQNAQDGGIGRQFDVTVIAVDIFGRTTLPAKIRCQNPAPAALT